MTVHLGVNILSVWGEHTAEIPMLVFIVSYSECRYTTLVNDILQPMYVDIYLGD